MERKIILPWKLTKVEIRHKIYVKDFMRIGLWLCYPYKVYSKPARINYVIHPDLLPKDVSKGSSLYGLSVTAVTRVSIIKRGISGVLNTAVIEMLPPKDAKKIRKYLLVVSGEGKSTGVGSRRDLSVLRGKEHLVFIAANVSGSGAHWIKYLVFLLDYPPAENAIVLYDSYITSCGNIRDKVILPIPNKRVPTEEELEVKRLNEWVVYKKVRDNLTGEVIELLELEFHEARKTAAYTDHEIIPRENVTLHRTSGRGYMKTHWTETYKILKHPVKVRTTRLTNCGNERIYEVEI